MTKISSVAALLVLLLAGTNEHTHSSGVDPSLPPYKAVSGISGAISSVGSDTMNNIFALWAEKFAHFYPSVRIQIEGKGSSTAPAALISGTAQFGPMSRPMKSSEIDLFEKKFGYKPILLRTAVDALAVFVNKDNPLQCLSLASVDAVFSKSRRRGGSHDISTWGALGLQGAWSQRPISLFGRNSASGTYGFFKEHVLQNGDYKDTVKEQPGSASVVQGIETNRFAVGYSGIGYATAGVRALSLKEQESSPCVSATKEHAYNGTYPLARFLYVYINKAPGKEPEPLVREFVKFIMSREGQEAVLKDGYYPIPQPIADAELLKIRK